ncbi:MAG: tRNA dihydrouridine(20/20a) synthase DusA [Caulobacterales bacterium]
MKYQPHRFSVAPMMDWTDRHCRAFHRAFSKHMLLYTEMLTADAILRGDQAKLLRKDDCEHPVALQLGGSDPAKLAAAARIGEDWGYCEINLNVGCPSDRVQDGRFGACLMREPDLVAECVSAMRAAVRIPVTVKNRIGVDDQDPNESLFKFVELVSETGCNTFIVHARKAILAGLSPKENREVPPLNYPLVQSLKAAKPALCIVLNGGLTSITQAEDALAWADGVMFGRAAYHNPALLGEVDARLFGRGAIVTPDAALDAYEDYMARELRAGTPLIAMTRHMLGLYQGQRGARLYRRIMSEDARKAGAGLEVVRAARAAINRAEIAA